MPTHRSVYYLVSLVIATALMAIAAPAAARVPVAKGENYDLEIGFRFQPRLEIFSVPDMSGGHDLQRDLMIRRLRFKGAGHVLMCAFEAQFRIDNVDQIGRNPTAQVDHSWVECPLVQDVVAVRVGNVQLPFSRETITGDEKQILVDRGLVHDDLDGLGLADLTMGLALKGSQMNGLIGYTAGVYDSRAIPGDQQDTPMFAGRVDINLFDTNDVMRDTAFGTEAQYLSFGINALIHPGIHAPGSDMKGSRHAIGVDAMADFLAGPGRLFLRAELDRRFVRDAMTGADQAAILWTFAAGYLIADMIQPAIRIDQRKIEDVEAQTILGFGVNVYVKEHDLKVQTDVLKQLSPDTGSALDIFRLQLQLEI